MAEITLKGTTIHTSGNLPDVGSKAPNFSLVDKELKEYHLSSFQDKKKFIYMVPSLDTEVCLLSTKKLEEKAKHHPNIAFAIVSADLPFAFSRICATEGLHRVTALSMMRSKDFARDYGMYITDGPLEGVCARAVIVLGEDNTVEFAQLIPEIAQEPDFDDIFAQAGI